MGNGYNKLFFLCLDEDFLTKQISLRIPKTMIVFRHRSVKTAKNEISQKKIRFI